eukprot:3690582-Pyramimonas_sp.AAC.1
MGARARSHCRHGIRQGADSRLRAKSHAHAHYSVRQGPGQGNVRLALRRSVPELASRGPRGRTPPPPIGAWHPAALAP